MPKVTINGTTIEVPEGTNLVAAAEMAGQEIPHYCYHPGLSVAGNCRMCLVDITAMSATQPKPLPKLQIGCNTTVQDGMVVESQSERVEEARRGVLEFLLINHPIDCPICDQAGECKLQEYYMDYGRYGSRFPLTEKVHKAKVQAIGPDIMLDQERCILCTRCVRFLDEVTETHELMIKERGDHSELSVADGQQVENPYATNIVDICPVGALTSREFRFQARVWYLEGTPGICPGCSTGCNIDTHSLRDDIYRLKPRANHEVNGFWMCDAGRRTYKERSHQDRLRSCASRREESFLELTWEDSAQRCAGLFARSEAVDVIASAAISMEEAYLLSRIADISGGTQSILSAGDSDIVGDDFLISSDRFANRRGLRELGFRESVAAPSKVRAVFAYRCDPASVDEAWATLLEGSDGVVHADERVGVSTEYANEIVAVGGHFEIDGTYLNRDSRLQLSQAAVEPSAGAVEGWKVLAAVLSELGGPAYASLDEVFAAMCESLGLRSGLRHENLESLGKLLADLRGPVIRQRSDTADSHTGSSTDSSTDVATA
ncbi:MAG: NADH-quinone oxidoreductase subunit G [Hyphomicrobiaceae bacterium]|jgi:NADH-quinone oxidoreductase subunit G